MTNYLPKHVMSCLAMLGLAACGGSSGDPVVLDPASFLVGTTPTSYDPASAAIVLNGGMIVDPRDTTLATNGDATLYASAAPVHRSAVAENDDVYAAVISTDGLAAEIDAGTYGRNGVTEMPAGSATFSGDYAAVTIRDNGVPAKYISSLLTGDAALTVAFDDGTLTGSVTNREVLTSSGGDFVGYGAEDIMIVDGMIAEDGTFTATTTGGAFTSPIPIENWSANTGDAEGVFGGANGEAAAGVVRFGHVLEGSSILREELGAFVVTED